MRLGPGPVRLSVHSGPGAGSPGLHAHGRTRPDPRRTDVSGVAGCRSLRLVASVAVSGPEALLRRLWIDARSGAPGSDRSLSPLADPQVIGHALASFDVPDQWVVEDVSGPYPGRTTLTVTAGDRLWSVVVRTDADERVEHLAVFARPDPFAGAPGGFVVCVGGASSAGKSSLMAALAAASPTPWTVFDERSLGSVPMRFLIWPERSGPMAEGFFRAVAVYAEAGNQVALSCTAAEGERHFPRVPRMSVYLDCSRGELLRREGARTDRWEGLAEETLADVLPTREAYDLHLDSESGDPDQLAAIVMDAVDQRRPRSSEANSDRL